MDWNVVAVTIPVVALIPDALIVTTLPTTILVAVASPNTGVTNVGLVANTSAPVPVSSVTADIKFALDGVAKNVATLAPRPLIPVETGSPEQLVRVPDCGVPNTGVTNVGLVANTAEPEPVSSVSAEARFADDGVARKVATLAARPEIPVETGSPVQLVRVPDCGVPNIGVTNVGDVESTTLPVPVLPVTPVPPLATGKVPVTPVVNGNPVQLVNVPDCGVPNTGVTNVGLVANTAEPEPVSSVSAVARLEELKEPNDVAVLTDVIAPVKLGILVVEVAVPVSDAVIVPALKLPEASLATIVDTVLALVALEATVNVDAAELLNVVDPDNPVPEVARVKVFVKFPTKVVAVMIPDEFTLPTLKLPNVPTEVSDEVKIPLPKVLLESTEFPSTL